MFTMAIQKFHKLVIVSAVVALRLACPSCVQFSVSFVPFNVRLILFSFLFCRSWLERKLRFFPLCHCRLNLSSVFEDLNAVPAEVTDPFQKLVSSHDDVDSPAPATGVDNTGVFKRSTE